MSDPPPEIQALMDQYERRVRREILWAISLCMIAIILPCVLAFVPVLKPKSEHANLWFQRSGSLMTVIAAVAYAKASNLLEMIRGGTFAESWSTYHKYSTLQHVVSWTSVILISIGTVIWGYGDLLVK